MRLSDFDYHLPKELIAQEPMNPREQAKLMVIRRKTQEIEHRHVADLPEIIQATDIIVLNNTKVFRARLHPIIRDKRVELFLVRPTQKHGSSPKNAWIAIGKPGRIFIKGAIVPIAEDFIGEIEERRDDGSFIISFQETHDEVIRKANTYGTVPVPPYIKATPKNDDYQTVYAKIIGSVAAPTAGFHLTPAIFETLQRNGVTICELTLHVGIGTFLPIKTERIDQHIMHSEWAHIPKETAETIVKAKQDGRRIIAIGTTTTRALEGAMMATRSTMLKPYTGDVDLFIKPGFSFKIIDGLLTNFHLPKSTLLLLVSAFGGIDLIKRAYAEAVRHRYRFYSFGDAMIII